MNKSSIKTISLFGSRRYKTTSVRSDIDLIVTMSDFIKPGSIRSFAEVTCPALDIFSLENGRAVSCMNESYIQANSNSELLSMLNAVEFWNKDIGFHRHHFTLCFG